MTGVTLVAVGAVTTGAARGQRHPRLGVALKASSRAKWVLPIPAEANQGDKSLSVPEQRPEVSAQCRKPATHTAHDHLGPQARSGPGEGMGYGLGTLLP